MRVGDKAFINDVHSDLYTKEGEILTIEGNVAAVAVNIEVYRNGRLGMDCIVDRFLKNKLCVIESRIANVG